MGRKKSEANAIDPATGKPLSPGVGYRGPGQYRARKLVDGKPDTKTFETDKLAREWLEETDADVRKGTYVDRSALDKVTVAEVIQAFVDDEMQIGGDRRDAAEGLGHISARRDGPMGELSLSKLTLMLSISVSLILPGEIGYVGRVRRAANSSAIGLKPDAV